FFIVLPLRLAWRGAHAHQVELAGFQVLVHGLHRDGRSPAHRGRHHHAEHYAGQPLLLFFVLLHGLRTRRRLGWLRHGSRNGYPRRNKDVAGEHRGAHAGPRVVPHVVTPIRKGLGVADERLHVVAHFATNLAHLP